MTLFMSIAFVINMGMIPVLTGGNFTEITGAIFGTDNFF